MMRKSASSRLAEPLETSATSTDSFYEDAMRKEYDFSDSAKNPYAKRLKKQITLRLNVEAITYFKVLAQETGVPYQNLINLYLTECAHSGKKLTLQWAS